MGKVVVLCTPNGNEMKRSSEINATERREFNSFRQLIAHLFVKGSEEKRESHATIVVLGTGSKKRSKYKLDQLDFDRRELLLKYFFGHLNVIVVAAKALDDLGVIAGLNEATELISAVLGTRIDRIETFTGTGDNEMNDFFARRLTDVQMQFEVSNVIPTMTSVLSTNLNKSPDICKELRYLNELIMSEIDFLSLLSNNKSLHLLKLCQLIGYWSFPAHDLSNDDLVYVAYVILKYALDHLNSEKKNIPSFNANILGANELLGLVFMVRDTYKSENPFHNFRHAVDVLQACFHYLVRLNCLPPFELFIQDANADDTVVLKDSHGGHSGIELVKAKHPKAPDTAKNASLRYKRGKASMNVSAGEKGTVQTDVQVYDEKQDKDVNASNSTIHLNALHCFGILIAALGHDVGHPGVTNAFLIQNYSPISLTYNERSVLELFHASVFISKILNINWPRLLEVTIDDDGTQNVRELIISCILATDMAVHFEYVQRIKDFNIEDSSFDVSKLKLISSLLIKCADISNVTRPLRISSQWAMALSMEFQEISKLEKKLNGSLDLAEMDADCPKIPFSVSQVMESMPDIHKGQIFFIDTFAENLFKNITLLVKELKYTCNIIEHNKAFWLKCFK